MQAITKTVSNTLTGIKEQPTRDAPINTQAWAGWLKLDLHQEPELERLVQLCGRWAKSFKPSNPPRWLSLVGATGTGKTHCATRLWRWSRNLITTGRTVSVGGVGYHEDTAFIPHAIYWPLFAEKLRNGNEDIRGNVNDCLLDAVNWPVVFVDDIGADRDKSGLTTDKLQTLLGARVGKWTILTSNLNLEQIGGMDTRISDRMIREPNLFIELTCQSHALRGGR